MSNSNRAAYHRQKRQEQREKGLCLHVGCPSPPQPGFVRCAKHLEEQNLGGMRHKYGLTPEQLANVLMQGRCAICGSTERLHIDHNHATGLVRERLCMDCNQGIGRFKEDPDLMLAAIAYLEKHNGSTVRPNPHRIEATPAVGNLAVRPAGGPGDQATIQCQDWYPGIFD